MGNRQAAPQKIVEDYQRMHLDYLEYQESIELGRKSFIKYPPGVHHKTVLVKAKEIPMEFV